MRPVRARIRPPGRSGRENRHALCLMWSVDLRKTGLPFGEAPTSASLSGPELPAKKTAPLPPVKRKNVPPASDRNPDTRRPVEEILKQLPAGKRAEPSPPHLGWRGCCPRPAWFLPLSSLPTAMTLRTLCTCCSGCLPSSFVVRRPFFSSRGWLAPHAADSCGIACRRPSVRLRSGFYACLST